MELKPCPFCGCRAQPPEFYAESKTARFIECETCGASIYRAEPGYADMTLIEAWNRRTDAQPWPPSITPT